MIKKFFQKIHEEYRSYSFAEKLFIIAMMVCSFATTADAAITRAVSNSVFIATYTADYFPYVWLFSLPVNFLIVILYNRFLPALGCGKMMVVFIGIALGINTLSAFQMNSFATLPFILYLWKDIFVMLLFQQIWSVIHSTSSIKRAKYLYGFIFGIGGIGSVFGSLVPSLFAVSLGSEKLLLTTIPIQLVLLSFYILGLWARKRISQKQNIDLPQQKGDFLGGIKLIKNSKLLSFILFIVLGMQISATLMDFQFQTYLQSMYPVKDLRTEFLGMFYGCVNTVNILIQFVVSYVMVRILGLQMTHFFVPFVLGINCLGFMLFPSFQMMTYSFGTLKSFDHSLFTVIKEMLYIPLSVDEKFKAKAIIDVFAYRSAKACASLCILGLQALTITSLNLYISWVLFTIFLLWMLSVTLQFKHYHRSIKV